MAAAVSPAPRRWTGDLGPLKPRARPQRILRGRTRDEPQATRDHRDCYQAEQRKDTTAGTGFGPPTAEPGDPATDLGVSSPAA